jgi:hypothetical protein
MPRFFPRRFSNPESLRTISAPNLIGLLLPYQGYLAGRGLQIARSNGDSDIDYEALVEILMNPDADMPRELMDCLYYVHEMSTPEAMIELLDEVPPGLLTVAAGVEPTPADVAAQVWLKDRVLLERKHSEQYLVRPKSFMSYQGGNGSVDAPPLVTSNAITCMQGEIDDWNEGHKRGRGCRLFVHSRDSEIWVLIRRGDPFCRVGTLENGKSSGVYYHPEKFDIVIYNPGLDTLAVSSGPKGQQQLYREVFGKHIFGNLNYFGVAGRYSLDPLRDRGEAALNCTAIPGIQWIRLTQVEIFQGNRLTVRYSHDDLFAALGEQIGAILARGFIAKASFAVKFVESKTPRSVSVWQPSRASYTRDEDRLLVEAWMQEQGFLAKPAEAVDAETEAVLADV